MTGGRDPSDGTRDGDEASPAHGLVFLLAVATALLAAVVLLPGPRPPAPDSDDPETRTCRFQRPDVPWDPDVTLFSGAFAPLPSEAERDVRAWVEIYGGAFADTFRAYLGRARRWEGRLAPVLRSHDVPADFLYLAVIESGFNPRAHSPFHAVGVWQFRRYTARHEGLAITWDVDERRDPVAATGAAARHLRRLHRRFGDWALAAAAYNAGPGRVYRGRRRAGRDAGFWELSRRRLLPVQTRNYVPKLLAAARMAHDPAGTGLDFVPLARPARETRMVEVTPGSPLALVAESAGLAPDSVRSLNPHLHLGRAPAREPARVRLPVSAVARFRERWAQIPPEERQGGVVHVVGRRETLGEIARSYDVPLRALREANDDVRARRLQVGQHLRVPVVR